MINLGKLDKITYHIAIRGHSYLPCDRLFSIICHLKTKHETVEMYTNWEEKAKEIYVMSMNGNQFRYCKSTFRKIFRHSVKRGA
jgi:hypothetical protein